MILLWRNTDVRKSLLWGGRGVVYCCCTWYTSTVEYRAIHPLSSSAGAGNTEGLLSTAPDWAILSRAVNSVEWSIVCLNGGGSCTPNEDEVTGQKFQLKEKLHRFRDATMAPAHTLWLRATAATGKAWCAE